MNVWLDLCPHQTSNPPLTPPSKITADRPTNFDKYFIEAVVMKRTFKVNIDELNLSLTPSVVILILQILLQIVFFYNLMISS